MRAIHFLAILSLAMLLSACGAASTSQPMPSGEMNMPPSGPSDVFGEVDAGLEERGGGAANAPGAPAQQPAAQRLVIKTANVAIQVENVSQAEAQIRSRTEQLGGYVVSVQTYGSDAEMSSQITFRVPAATFDQALSGVEGLAHKVLSRSVSGDDVTEEFVDLESRLRNLEATRDRLLTLLNQATDVEDALQVNQALSDVQGQIEQIQGRMKYLRDSAAFSTITVDLDPVPPLPTIIENDSWQPLRVAREALAGLVGFAQGLANLAIVILIWSPIWLVLWLIGRWIWRWISKRPRRPPPVPPVPPVAPQG